MRNNTWKTHFSQSLDLNLVQSIVVDPEFIDESHEGTASLVVADSSA